MVINRINAVILFLLLPFILTACVETPGRAAKEFINALINLDGNKILERTCAAERENIQSVGLLTSAFSIIPQLFGLDLESEGDVSDLKFTTIELYSNTAYVHVSGEMRVAVIAFANNIPIDETWMMVKENGKWKWCGSVENNLSQALPTNTTSVEQTRTLSPIKTDEAEKITQPSTKSKITNTPRPTRNSSPTKTPQPNEKLNSSPWQACPDTYQSRLHVGDRAYISYYPPLANRVRAKPNKNGHIIGHIQPGEEMDVIGGPECANQWVWWKVHDDTGLIGWTSEGDNEGYWLVPMK